MPIPVMFDDGDAPVDALPRKLKSRASKRQQRVIMQDVRAWFQENGDKYSSLDVAWAAYRASDKNSPEGRVPVGVAGIALQIILAIAWQILVWLWNKYRS